MAEPLILGLGTNCELTHNLRRVYGLETAFPFDWWITPLTSLKPLVENGFDFDITDGNLERTEDRMSVINRRWKILHHHDFPRKDGQIRDDWREFIPETAQKYDALARRLDAALDQAASAVIFINGNGGHEYLTRDERLACGQAGLYAGVIAAVQARWPQLRFMPVICNPSPASAPPSEATVLTVKDYGDRESGKDFAKSPRGWSEALALVPTLSAYAR
jgi:hypothetical protein